MSKKLEYTFWIVTAGNGMLEKGCKVGFVAVKSKKTDPDFSDLYNTAYANLGPQVGGEDKARKHFVFELKEIKEV